MKIVDLTSAHLHQLALTGKSFEGELDAVDKGRIVLHFGLKGAVIVGVQLGGRAPDGGTIESVTLACEGVEVEQR